MANEEPIIIETFYTICYDLPSGAVTKVRELEKKKEEDRTQEEKEFIRIERLKEILRIDTAREVGRLATYFNNSVYLLPPHNLKKAEEVIKQVRERYEKELGKDYTPLINVIKFHPDASDKVRLLAKDSLLKRLNTLLNNLDGLEKAIAQRKTKKIRPSEKRDLRDAIDTLDDLAKKFKIRDDCKNLLDIVSEKIKDLESE